MLRGVIVSALLLCSAAVSLGQTSPPRLFSRLTVNQTQLAFSYAGDIWIVDRAGGENTGITPDVEVEITPKDWMAGRDPQLERAVQVAMDGTLPATGRVWTSSLEHAI